MSRSSVAVFVLICSIFLNACGSGEKSTDSSELPLNSTAQIAVNSSKFELNETDFVSQYSRVPVLLTIAGSTVRLDRAYQLQFPLNDAQQNPVGKLNIYIMPDDRGELNEAHAYVQLQFQDKVFWHIPEATPDTSFTMFWHRFRSPGNTVSADMSMSVCLLPAINSGYCNLAENRKTISLKFGGIRNADISPVDQGVDNPLVIKNAEHTLIRQLLTVGEGDSYYQLELQPNKQYALSLINLSQTLAIAVDSTNGDFSSPLCESSLSPLCEFTAPSSGEVIVKVSVIDTPNLTFKLVLNRQVPFSSKGAKDQPENTFRAVPSTLNMQVNHKPSYYEVANRANENVIIKLVEPVFHAFHIRVYEAINETGLVCELRTEIDQPLPSCVINSASDKLYFTVNTAEMIPASGAELYVSLLTGGTRNVNTGSVKQPLIVENPLPLTFGGVTPDTNYYQLRSNQDSAYQFAFTEKSNHHISATVYQDLDAGNSIRLMPLCQIPPSKTACNASINKGNLLVKVQGLAGQKNEFSLSVTPSSNVYHDEEFPKEIKFLSRTKGQVGIMKSRYTLQLSAGNLYQLDLENISDENISFIVLANDETNSELCRSGFVTSQKQRCIFTAISNDAQLVINGSATTSGADYTIYLQPSSQKAFVGNQASDVYELLPAPSAHKVEASFSQENFQLPVAGSTVYEITVDELSAAITLQVKEGDRTHCDKNSFGIKAVKCTVLTSQQASNLDIHITPYSQVVNANYRIRIHALDEDKARDGALF